MEILSSTDATKTILQDQENGEASIWALVKAAWDKKEAVDLILELQYGFQRRTDSV